MYPIGLKTIMQTFHFLWKKFISQFALTNQDLIVLSCNGIFCLNLLNFFHIDLPRKENWQKEVKIVYLFSIFTF